MSTPGETHAPRYKDTALLAGVLQVLDGLPEGVPRAELRSRLVDAGLEWLPEGASFSEELPDQLEKIRGAGFPLRIDTTTGVERVILDRPHDVGGERFLPLDASEAETALALHRCLSRLDPGRVAPQHPSAGSMKAYIPRDEVEFSYGGDGTTVRGLAYLMDYEPPDWLVAVLTDDGPKRYRMESITDLITHGPSPRDGSSCPGQPPICEPVGLAPHHYREGRRPGRPRPDAALRDVRRIIDVVLAYGAIDAATGAVTLPVAETALAVGLDEPTVRDKFTAVGAETTTLAWFDPDDDSFYVEPFATWARRLDAGQAFLLALRLACLDALDPDWALWLLGLDDDRARVDQLRAKLDRFLSAANVSVPTYPCGPNLLAMFLDEDRILVSIRGGPGDQMLQLERLELRNWRWYGHGTLETVEIGPDGLDLAEIKAVHLD